MSSAKFAPALVAALLCASCATQTAGLKPGPGFRKSLQEALIQAKPGAVIEIPEGSHDIDAPLSLTVDNVTLRGKGMNKSVLSFKNQASGSAGLLVTSNHFTIEDLGVEDTKGDGIKVKGGDGVTIRRFRAEWTGGPKESNGSYGIYPVECKNVLIEESVVKGAADAGIYVGQSTNIVVRRSTAEQNVAGIEIENSAAADVYENIATANTGGILVFNLPDLPMQTGRQVRVYKNQINSNNTPNFAPKGNMVAKVPAGTGLMILAARGVEIFGNTIRDNASSNVNVISYMTTGNPIKDATFDPFTGGVFIHDNTITGGGNSPDGMTQLVAKAGGMPVPDILFDGIMNPKNTSADGRLCIANNGDARFLNFDAPHEMKKPSKDLKPHACSLPALPEVKLPAGL
jgi:parallel beta-helix repeat protein